MQNWRAVFATILENEEVFSVGRVRAAREILDSSSAVPQLVPEAWHQRPSAGSDHRQRIFVSTSRARWTRPENYFLLRFSIRCDQIFIGTNGANPRDGRRVTFGWGGIASCGIFIHHRWRRSDDESREFVVVGGLEKNVKVHSSFIANASQRIAFRQYSVVRQQSHRVCAEFD